jgi:hypothetical protein
MLFDIIEYLGKFEDGVIVLITLNYKDNYYDSTFFYREDFVTLTINEELEEIIGKIEEWDGYNDLVIDIMKKTIPFDEIIGRVDDIDFSIYFDDNQ